MQQKSRKFIAYYRVSTDRQGISKLGLEAQQETVRQYLAENDILISEVVEVESGKKSTHIALISGFAHPPCRNHSAEVISILPY